MSLGFLTESALVPSKAKPIQVDAKSLVDLKAVVFQKDQERQRRLRDALTADDDGGHSGRRLSKYAHLRGGNKSRKRLGASSSSALSRGEERTGRSRCNRGVEARNRRDEEMQELETPDEDDDRAWHKRSTEMLRKKARLYEDMARGEGASAQASGDFLVDFEAKRSSTAGGVAKQTELVEITDEFGRSRRVAIDSEEYTAFVKTQQQDKPDRPAAQTQNVTCDVAEAGKSHEEEEAKGSIPPGYNGSFVVSQWETRLKAADKVHLQEVHERATVAQSVARASSSSTALDRKTRKQQRLERLRSQRKNAAAPPAAVAGTPSGDAAIPDRGEAGGASEQATDFLNQLSSLM
ncbi:hypothetical protein BBJ28_00025206 [Nothophytophthora sp. Chile5]|nr:hypothetical protein BBJ28_00025206 [Nothophytophthora sp. Chile5]